MAELDDRGLDAVNAKLAQIVKLLALAAIEHAVSVKEKALRLNSAGLQPKEIAALLGTTPNAVSVALSAGRRKKKAKAVRRKQ